MKKTLRILMQRSSLLLLQQNMKNRSQSHTNQLDLLDLSPLLLLAQTVDHWPPLTSVFGASFAISPVEFALGPSCPDTSSPAVPPTKLLKTRRSGIKRKVIH